MMNKTLRLVLILMLIAINAACQSGLEATLTAEPDGDTTDEEVPVILQGIEGMIGNWEVEWQFDEGQDFNTQPLNLFINQIQRSDEQEGVYLGTGCLYSPDPESMMPMSMQGIEIENDGYELRIISTVFLHEEGPLILLFTGKTGLDASTGMISQMEGAYASMHGSGTWVGSQIDHQVIVCPEVEVMEEVYTYDVYAHSNIATDPSEDTGLFESITLIASSALRVETPEGEEIVVQEYTDIFTPDVDFIDSFRYLVSSPGFPTVGQPYGFTLLDVLGSPIPGTEVEDIWYACSQDAAENLQAVYSPGEHISLAWDAVDVVPGEFDPSADPQIGEYKLNIFPIHPEGPTTFGAAGIASSHHIVPWESFDPGVEGEPDGTNFGVSLSELQEGVFEIEIESISLPHPESGGVRFECFVRDRSQNLLMEKAGGDINFMPPGFISGTVLDIDGNPIAGVHVVACEYGVDEAYCVEGITSEEGLYRIFALIPGEYRVGIYGQPGWVEQSYDGKMDVDEADRVVVESGVIVAGIDFTLTPIE